MSGAIRFLTWKAAILPIIHSRCADKELGWISAEVINVAKNGDERRITLVDDRGKVKLPLCPLGKITNARVCVSGNRYKD